MGRQDGGNRFDLNDDLARDNDVGPEPVPDRHGFVDDRNGNLAFEWNACRAQLMAQALLIHRPNQSGSRVAMHLYSQPDHLFGQFPG